MRNNYSARVRSRKYPMVVFYFVFDMAITNSYIYLQLLGRKRTKTLGPMARIEREKLAIRLAFGDGILAPSKSYMAESTQRQLSQENLERLPGGNLSKSRRGLILTGKRQRACGSRGSRGSLSSYQSSRRSSMGDDAQPHKLTQSSASK